MAQPGRELLCAHPECEFLPHTDASVSPGFCCQKCQGRFQGEAWAFGGKRHYKHCEGRLPGMPELARKSWEPPAAPEYTPSAPSASSYSVPPPPPPPLAPLAGVELPPPPPPPGESLAGKPWMEVREDGWFCLACKRWATEDHLANEKHEKRAAAWEAWASDCPGEGWAWPAPEEEWLELRTDAGGWESYYCTLCNAFADERHLATERHERRVASWRLNAEAHRPAAQPVEARVLEVLEAPNSAGEPVVLLQACGQGEAPGSLPLRRFEAWPLPPRRGDVLEVAAKAGGELPGVPRVREMAAALGDSELQQFATRLKLRCQSGDEALAEVCRAVSERCRPYLVEALASCDLRVAGPLLEALRSVAREKVAEERGTPQCQFVEAALYSPLVRNAVPKLIEQGALEPEKGEELHDRLVELCPSALPFVRPILRAVVAAVQARDAQPMEQPGAPAGASLPGGASSSAGELPRHWTTTNFPAQGWATVAIEKDDPLFLSLSAALATDGANLGHGRDVIEAGDYKKLHLKRAWRVEHCDLWKRYSVERESVLNEIQSRRLPLPKLEVRNVLESALRGLPNEPRKEVNETFLLHGAKADDVLALLQNGPSEKFSAGLFGFGTHLAEDAGKSDQCVSGDAGPSAAGLQDLHARLYRQGKKHPGNVYYIFVCRVTMGIFLRASSGDVSARDLDGGKLIWAKASRRELAVIPGVKPPLHYHSLVAELGEQIHRYREFIQFHDARLYPEYLLAYQRKS